LKWSFRRRTFVPLSFFLKTNVLLFEAGRSLSFLLVPGIGSSPKKALSLCYLVTRVFGLFLSLPGYGIIENSEGHSMEILGIGPLELLFIVLLALLILGPKDLVRIGKSLGQWLYRLVRSDFWKTARDATEKVRSLPNELMREAGIEEMKRSMDLNAAPPAEPGQKTPDPGAEEPPQAGSPDSSRKIAGLPEDDPNKILPPSHGRPPAE
jgi:sec-independent protein translocase protein TatB